MSEEPKKKPSKDCPVPKQVRDVVKETAEIVDKHKQIVRKLNPFA